MSLKNLLENSCGKYGIFGGCYVSEMHYPIMKELEDYFGKIKKNSDFLNDLKKLQKNYTGRPTPLYFAKNLTEKIGGAKIYLKNEGLLHTGAHKMNHCLGQALIAKKMGKKRVIAETGAGQHGLATASVCAKLGLECVVYMGAKDVKRQRPNVFWMERLGAKVIPVEYGSQTLKDSMNAAFKDLAENPDDTYYLVGTICGPHPYPKIITFFQKVISEEIKEQLLEQEGRSNPDVVVACVGGGSNAIGCFYEFLDDFNVTLVAVEAGGKGIKEGQHAARFEKGEIGVSDGMKTYFLQNEDGQMKTTSSISAGLDFSGVSPIHSFLRDKNRIKTKYTLDNEAIEAWEMLSKNEGIFPALESSHAIYQGIKIAKDLDNDKIVVINVSGRGDKDLFITTKAIRDNNFNDFLFDQYNENKRYF